MTNKLPLEVICRGETRSDLCFKELFACSAENELEWIGQSGH